MNLIPTRNGIRIPKIKSAKKEKGKERKGKEKREKKRKKGPANGVISRTTVIAHRAIAVESL